MTKLIVALDGPEPFMTMITLNSGAHGVWFKVGPLTLLNLLDVNTIETLLRRHRAEMGLSVFYDAKLADHGPYICTEVAKRLGANGYASLSTATDEATEAAVRGAEGSPLRVWRHVAPTSQDVHQLTAVNAIYRAINQGAHGVICGAWHLQGLSMERRHLGTEGREFDFVCPGVRMDDFGDEHVATSEPKDCAAAGVTHAVVGRPIWQSLDPVAAARRYLEALK